MSRRTDYTLYAAFALVIAIIVALLTIGCASSEPPPCIPQIKWLTPPPERITVVVTFSVEIPNDPEYKFIEFEHEVILTDSEEFIEILYNDLIACTAKFTNAKIELIRIKAAQLDAVEAHGGTTDPD